MQILALLGIALVQCALFVYLFGRAERHAEERLERERLVLEAHLYAVLEDMMASGPPAVEPITRPRTANPLRGMYTDSDWIEGGEE